MAGLFDLEGNSPQAATGGTGLFGNSADFITKERAQIANDFTRDYEDRKNPFRMLGGALKTINLQNSPEVQQMRQTDEIMKGVDIENIEQVKEAAGKLKAIGNIKGYLELLQAHKSFAPAADDINTTTFYGPKGEQIPGSLNQTKQTAIINGQKIPVGDLFKLGITLEKETSAKDEKLFELSKNEDGSFSWKAGNSRKVADPNEIHTDPNKMWSTKPFVKADSGQTINVNTGPDYAAKQDAERVNTIIEDGATATNSVYYKDLILNSLDSISAEGEVETGIFAPLKLNAARVLEGLGAPEEMVNKLQNITEAENVIGFLNREVLDLMVAQKGNQSDSDSRRMQAAAGSISDEKQGLKFRLKAAKNLDLRKKEKGEFYSEYSRNQRRGGNRLFAPDIDAAWRDYINSTPLIHTAGDKPMFYYEFVEKIKAQGGTDMDQINKAWKGLF